MIPSIHRFESSGDAYDATQTDETINDGDVLVVESERVVGFLVKAWPVAVTPEHGAFHSLAPDADITCLGKREAHSFTVTIHPDNGEPFEQLETFDADPGTDYTTSVRIALAIAARKERYAIGDVVVLHPEPMHEGPHADDEHAPPAPVVTVLEVVTHPANYDYVLGYRVHERGGEIGTTDAQWVKPGVINRLHVPVLDGEIA